MPALKGFPDNNLMVLVKEKGLPIESTDLSVNERATFFCKFESRAE